MAVEARGRPGDADPSVRDVGAPPDLSELGPKRANELYHDAAARRYDAKWSISFDERCVRYVRERADRMLPARRYGRVLDVGVGTGFFLLNLWQAGYVARAFGCDVSTGMLGACAESASGIGCEVELRPGDAEALPYLDGAFDLVVGHAILHHVPDPLLAVSEMWRVLAPGGALLLAGEPTTRGDRLARGAGRAAWRGYRAAAAFVPRLRRPAGDGPVSEDERILRELEWKVDLHTFAPPDLAGLLARAGFRRVRVETEELLSSLSGWVVRTIEAEAPPGLLGPRWGRTAYRAYL